MPHFFIQSDNIKDSIIEVSDKELLKHLVLSLRVRIGEKLKFIDENEIQYETLVKSVSNILLEARVLDFYPSKRKLPYPLHLIQCVLKQDAQSLLISNAVQCGVDVIYPVISDNCAVSYKNVCSKVQRWQKIADETSKQCERANFARVNEVLDIKEMLEQINGQNVIVFAEKYAEFDMDEAVKIMDKTCPIYVLTGPEGGFSDEEFKYFKEKKYKLVSLGDLIFKAPNAVTAGISNIVTRLK